MRRPRISGTGDQRLAGRRRGLCGGSLRSRRDRRPRPKRWADAVDRLRTLQAEYEAGRDRLPESLGRCPDRRVGFTP